MAQKDAEGWLEGAAKLRCKSLLEEKNILQNQSNVFQILNHYLRYKQIFVSSWIQIIVELVQDSVCHMVIISDAGFSISLKQAI